MEELSEAGDRASNLIDDDRLPCTTEELAEAGGRASSAAPRPQAAACDLFDRGRLAHSTGDSPAMQRHGG